MQNEQKKLILKFNKTDNLQTKFNFNSCTDKILEKFGGSPNGKLGLVWIKEYLDVSRQED